ncbi:MAG: hypothetical protein J6A25_01000 [Lachnospiraceae bacterium]|nr:hypothetical protein [Lachnospiraceae bacterium]
MIIAIFMYMFISLGIACFIGVSCNAAGFEFFNPVVIYNTIKVNIFGTILITILLNTILAPYAIGYWVYKACTVGRKK